MGRTLIEQETQRPQDIIRQLLEPSGLTAVHKTVPALVGRRALALERDAPEIVRSARKAGVEIEFLGLNPLPGDPVLYEGPENDWVLAPVTTMDDAVVPPRERRQLSRLTESRIDFPLTYIAHEVRKEQTRALLEQQTQPGPVVLDRAEVAELVGPVPPPEATVALGDRMSRRSTKVLKAAVNTSKVVGVAALGVAAAPVVLVGGALASLATLDPIILGVIPAVTARSGEPAAWFVLARWDW